MRSLSHRLTIRCPLVLLVVLLTGAAPDDEPEVAVNVYGNTIQVKVTRGTDSPVAGYPLRLRDSDKKVLTEGHSNAEGRWEQFLAREGKYEVQWGPKQHGRTTVTVRETVTTLPPTGVLPCCQTVAPGRPAPPPPSAWLLWAVVGGVLALVGFSGLVVWAGRLRTRPSVLSEDVPPLVPARRLPTNGQLVFVTLLFAVGLGLIGWSLFRSKKEEPAPTAPAWPSDVAEGARDYLRKRGVEPLSGALERLLLQPGTLVKSEHMAPVGDSAPEFELTEVHGHKWHLQEALAKGPVVVVFYFGYGCDHCVSQLFALQQDIRYFRDLGAEVVAISDDPPAETLQQYKRFGAFDFPVLSDPGNKVAQAYGVFTPDDGTKPGQQLHGTFVIDRQGTVQWGNSGPEPFTGNRTLLYKLADMEERLPGRK